MCFSGEFGKDGEEVVDEFEKNAAINTSDVKIEYKVRQIDRLLDRQIDTYIDK